MTILDKFLILFETDASDAEKEVGGLVKKLKDVKKTADDAVQSTDDIGKQFSLLGVKALSAVGGLLALSSVIGGVVSTAARIDELGKFADMIGEDVEQLDAWGGAVTRAGGNADAFRASVASLNEELVDAKVKGQNEITPFFHQLGISIVSGNGKIKSTLELLPELADSFSRIDKQKALGVGRKLGLDEGTIMLLQSGRGEIDKLLDRQKKLGVVTKEAGKVSAEFNDIMADFKQISGFVAQNLLISFVPAITWTIDKLIKLTMWAEDNKPILIGLFLGLAAAAIPSLISIATAAWTALAPLLVMAAPFIGIAAAAAAAGVAISLVAEDIWDFFHGQNSLLGEAIKKWPVLGDVVNYVVDDFKAFFEMIKALWALLTDLGQFLINIFIAPEKALKSFTDSMQKLNDVVEKFIGENFKKLSEAAESVKSFLGFGDEEKKKEPGLKDKKRRGEESKLLPEEEKEPEQKKTFGSKIKSFFGFGGDEKKEEKKVVSEVKKNIEIGQNSIAVAATNPMAAQTNNSITNGAKTTNKTTTIQTGDIVIKTEATDPDGIAKGISGSLQKEMRTTVENFDDGIAI